MLAGDTGAPCRNLSLDDGAWIQTPSPNRLAASGQRQLDFFPHNRPDPFIQSGRTDSLVLVPQVAMPGTAEFLPPLRSRYKLSAPAAGW